MLCTLHYCSTGPPFHLMSTQYVRILTFRLDSLLWSTEAAPSVSHVYKKVNPINEQSCSTRISVCCFSTSRFHPTLSAPPESHLYASPLPALPPLRLVSSRLTSLPFSRAELPFIQIVALCSSSSI